MAADWIKMRGNLWDDPRIAKLVDITDSSEAAVIGGLYWLWATADQHTADGVMPGLSCRQIDRKTGVQGLGQGLIDIGWLADHPEGVLIVNFEEHNGVSAKRRGMEAKRKGESRKASAFDADKQQTNDGHHAELEKEKEKEKELKTHSPEPGLPGIADPEPIDLPKASRPACPHQQIIDLYHQALPTGTQVRVWNETRMKTLQARWREDPKRQDLGWWERFFKYVAESEFLTGQTPAANGRDPFVVSLDWLINPQNFAKTVEGKYHRSAA